MATTIQRIESNPLFCHATVHGGIVYVSNFMSPGKNVREQTRRVLSGIDALLARAGSDKSKILSATIVLADMRDFNEMNSVWDKWVAPGHAPARACVESKPALPGYQVAIALMAAQ